MDYFELALSLSREQARRCAGAERQDETSADGSRVVKCVACNGGYNPFCLDCGGQGTYVIVADSEDDGA